MRGRSVIKGSLAESAASGVVAKPGDNRSSAIRHLALGADVSDDILMIRRSSAYLLSSMYLSPSSFLVSGHQMYNRTIDQRT